MDMIDPHKSAVRLVTAVLATALAVGIALPAWAQTDTPYSDQIARTGLAATATALAAVPDPTPSDRFALGGVLFLGAIEAALQARYATGVPESLTGIVDFPILRLPIPENPAPATFDATMIDTMFAGISNDMAAAIAALDRITDADPVSVRINTADIWFDINSNDQRDSGENWSDVAGLILGGGFGPLPDLTVAFDTADAAWLSAYAHLLSGVSELVLAFSPSATIDKVITATAAMEALAPVFPDPSSYFSLSEFTDVADVFAVIIGALEQQPDPARTRAAHAHFLDMIADNRVFWARVARESDNDAEWIPNKRQQSVLPIPFPTDTGARWQAVLADAEALLQGDLLIPYWRLGDSAGINIARLFQDPPAVDIAAFVQGYGLLPYMEQGRLIGMTNLNLFTELVGGNAGLYMVVLN